ncbi:uncharacterized protein LOC130914484 isoform X2 [Corythoichthys intestinalis]|uniref:uncharacterized protein LOC130914484 isoform X2 n=1 Tax=Corythoichthys intestinalis TaxID=161448 RepID=UPI0025A5808C|nr:uncharacterized protein LOC130914484 isoform X2 [Corythoichthys intestinalis]
MLSPCKMMVRAHFTAIASNPCPPLTGLCTEGVNCTLHRTYVPFSGTKPSSGWCVRQWEQVLPSNYESTISLNANTTFYLSIKAAPHVRVNSGRLNHPAYVALPPPIRARKNCPHHIHLSVKDLDGDKVRCRFAIEKQGECRNCSPHSFIELNKDACTLTFTGIAKFGQYSIYLMAEDYIPTPEVSQTSESQPLSSVPVHLSLTVEQSTSSCADEPVATVRTPRDHATFHVLPFEDVKFEVDFMSQKESISEIAVVGQPGLVKYGFTSTGAMSRLSMSWVRGENTLARVFPICFVANSLSLQSEPRCVWLYQREIRTLPNGTELICNKTAMTLILPIGSLSNINLDELQLNSPACPITFNNTHLTAHIELDGCGTRTVHTDTELVYTNTLKSVHPSSLIRRQPSLILPLACRIPAVQARGPNFNVNIPTIAFDNTAVRLEFHLPGEGPMWTYTSNPQFNPLELISERVRGDASPVRHIRAVQGEPGSRIKELDLHLISNSTLDRSELSILRCVESATADFSKVYTILEQGCKSSLSTKEIRASSNVRIFRLDLSELVTVGNTMYVECEVDLCITFLPSQKCAKRCNQVLGKSVAPRMLSKHFIVRSKPVSLVITTPAPTTSVVTNVAGQTEVPTAAPVENVTSTSNAPERASFMAVGLTFNIICIFLQHIFVH